jgi:hypothetical protein
MPDYTVKADVDSMLRAANNAAIRSAIGLGQTDVPVLAGIAAGTVPFAALLQTSISGSFHVSLVGFPSQRHFTFGWAVGGASTVSTGAYAWSSSSTDSDAVKDLLLARDAAGILAQRNGTAKQVHRVYNTFLGTTANEWGGFDWLTTTNTLRIGTEHGGTGTARPIDFVTGGVARWQITAAGHLIGAGGDGLYDIGTFGSVGRVRDVNAAGSVYAYSFRRDSMAFIQFNGIGIITLTDHTSSTWNRLQLGGTTSAYPAIKRNGTGIDIVLANDSGFAPLSSGALTISGGGANITGIVNGTAFTSGFYVQTNTQFMFGTGGVGDVALQKNATGVVEINNTTAGTFRDLRCRSVIQQPPATITPASNGDLVVEATSNTLLTFKFKGSDGTVRSGTMVVA